MVAIDQDILSLTYKEAQQSCKELGLGAQGKKTELQARLQEQRDNYKEKTPLDRTPSVSHWGVRHCITIRSCNCRQAVLSEKF